MIEKLKKVIDKDFKPINLYLDYLDYLGFVEDNSRSNDNFIFLINQFNKNTTTISVLKYDKKTVINIKNYYKTDELTEEIEYLFNEEPNTLYRHIIKHSKINYDYDITSYIKSTYIYQNEYLKYSFTDKYEISSDYINQTEINEALSILSEKIRFEEIPVIRYTYKRNH